MQTISVKKSLYRLTMPIFIDIALVMLLGAVDTVMLSRYSDDAVAAVGLDNQLISFVFLIYQFISMGAAIICAQYFGAGLRKRFMQIVWIAAIVNIVLGLIVSGSLWLWSEELLRAFGLREQLIADGARYLEITGSLSFFQALSLTFSAALRSTGKTVKPMLVTVIVNIINMLANYALIFGNWGCPAMGVEGAAWASAFSRIAATLILLSFMPSIWRAGSPAYYIPFRNYFRPFPWSEMKNLFKIGIPAMSEEMSYSLSQIVITYFINQISTEALTTKVYCSTTITFVILFSTSIVQGGDILVGHYVGQLRYRAAYILGNFVYHRSRMLTLIVAGTLAVGGHGLMTLLTDNADIIRTGTWIFIIDFFLSYGRVKNVFACGTLRATGDAVYPVIVGVICQWSVAVGIAWCLGIPMGLGIIGMWIGFCLDENLRGVILMKRWHSLKWKGKSFAQK